MSPGCVPRTPQGAAACDRGQKHRGGNHRHPLCQSVPAAALCWHVGGTRAAASTAEHPSCSPQTTPFTTSMPSPTTRAPPWGDTTLPTARTPSPASGTVSTTPGKAERGTGAASGLGQTETPCQRHPNASSPLLTAHLPISTVLPRCHLATSAAAMPTCSSTSWPAHPPACSQPCLPGDVLHHP